MDLFARSDIIFEIDASSVHKNHWNAKDVGTARCNDWATLSAADNCAKVVEGCEHVFNLAADMGGMGFIQSNHSVIMYNNTMVSP